MTKHINKLHAGCMSNVLRKKNLDYIFPQKSLSLESKRLLSSGQAEIHKRRCEEEEEEEEEGREKSAGWGVGEPVLPPDPVFRGEGARWLQMPPAPLSTPKVQGRPNHPFNPRRMRGVRARTVLPNLPGGGLWGFGLGCHGCSLKR